MNDKSHVSLERHVCLVCGVAYDTGNLLLDKRLRASMERHTTTGWGLCPEHQKLSDDGFVALVECDPQRSGSPSSRWSRRQRAERTASIRCVALWGGAPFFLLRLVPVSSCLRRCALRLPPGGKPCGLSPPRDAWRPSMRPNRLRRIGRESAATVEPASQCLGHGAPLGSDAHRTLKAGRPRPRNMAGRAVVRVAHQAACGVSPLSGFHHSLAPLG